MAGTGINTGSVDYDNFAYVYVGDSAVHYWTGIELLGDTPNGPGQPSCLVHTYYYGSLPTSWLQDSAEFNGIISQCNNGHDCNQWIGTSSLATNYSMWWTGVLTDTVNTGSQPYLYLEDSITREPVFFGASSLTVNVTFLNYKPNGGNIATMKQFLTWWPQCAEDSGTKNPQVLY